MADFAAVLRKTIAALKDNTPEARDRIYQKARSTIDAKLKAITPPPPADVVERQLRMLEEAIATVEAEFAPPVISDKPDTDLDDVLRELEALSKAPSSASWNVANKPAPAPVVANAPAPAAPAPEAEEPQAPAPETPATEPVAEAGAAEPEAEQPKEEVAPADESEETSEPAAEEPAAGPADEFAKDEAASAEADDTVPSVATDAKQKAEAPGQTHAESRADAEQPDDAAADATSADATPVVANETDPFEERPALRELRERREAKRSLKRPLIAACIILVLAAAAVAGWMFRDDLTQTADDSGTEIGTVVETEVAATPIEEEPEAAAEESAPEQPVRKLTQRLLPDGSEVDEGPAGGPASIGEGTSVAASTETAAAESGGESNQQGSEAAVPVGQKAIFYEERTVQEQASASDGTVVWSIEQESPGAGLPPEPVIYAEATIPAKRLSLKMSIRRNVDQSLPASYIAELIFLTPEDFPGGAVGNVASMSLKRTEQDAGNRLLGIPAKIADGFFLVALSDNKADMEANNLLLDRMQWIDIPIVYTSGRRALITLEKGVPGGQIFNQALTAWKQAMSG